jgi:hypothetical protein
VQSACSNTALVPRTQKLALGFALLASGALAVLALLVVNVGNSLYYPVVTSADAQDRIQAFVSPDEFLSTRQESPQALFPHGERTAFVSGQGAARVVTWRARVIDLDVSTPGGGTLAIAEQFYPGRTAQRTADGPSLAVNGLASRYGVLAVDVPSGNTHIALRLGWTPHERLEWQISAVSAVVLLGMVLWALWESKLTVACRARHKSVTAPS